MENATLHVEQEVLVLTKFSKHQELMKILNEQDNNTTTVVYVLERRTVNFSATLLCHDNIQTTSIHGPFYTLGLFWFHRYGECRVARRTRSWCLRGLVRTKN